MRHVNIISALLCLSLAATAQAGTLHVDTDASTGGDGSTWNMAYKYLQDAMYHAAGDSTITEIRVAGGTYYPDQDEASIVTPDDPGAAFTIVLHASPNHHDISLLGGYRGKSGLPSGTENTRDETTTLSGNVDDDGNISDPGDSWTILYAGLTGKPGAVTIDGFTFVGGYANGTTTPPANLWEYHGAAIFLNGGYSGTLTINDCVFQGNHADAGGGAVFVINRASTILITACDFLENEAYDDSPARGTGGALYVVDCDSLTIGDDQDEVLGCTFEDNSAYLTGGAVEIQGTSTAISHSWFEANWVEGDTAVGGAVNVLGCGPENEYTFAMTDCTVIENFVNDVVSINGYGGGVAIKGYRGDDPTPAATFTRVDFIDNIASTHGGALMLYSEDLEIFNPYEITGTCYLGPVLIDECTFVGNTCDWEEFQQQGEDGGLGGAIWARNVDLTCTNGTEFDENISSAGGGAIWHEAVLLGGQDGFPLFGDASLTLTDCTFRANQMTSTTASGGGGGLFMEGMKDGSNETNLTGTITNCSFIDNESDRGGGIYIHDSDEIEISGCDFVNNDGRKAGGGIGIGDPGDLQTTEVKICKSRFISNTSLRGGAIHNHEGAVTYMVNCYLTGNSSTKEGGGVFNSRHTGTNLPAKLYMHNCLVAGNLATNSNSEDDDDRGGGVFNGFEGNSNGVEATMEMRHCTLMGNYAEATYGGALNVVSNSTMKFYNSISRDNTSEDIADAFKNQLYHVAGYTAGMDPDANNFVADGTLPAIYEPSNDPPTWTAGDPVFTEDGSSTVTWTWSTYDPDTGETTFSTSDPGSAAVGMLFQPDGPETPMLIITYVGNSSFICLGWREDTTTTVNITGNLYDLHIDDSGVADDFGDAAYIDSLTNGGSGDVCDLDGNGETDEPLPYDLDVPNARNQGTDPLPDAGAYEIVYP